MGDRRGTPREPKGARYKEPKKHINADTLGKAAVHLGMSYKTLQEWSRLGVIRPTKAGKWSTRAIGKARLERMAETEKIWENTSEKSPALEKWRELRVRKEELDLAEREGSLISREEVEAANVQKVLALKAGLLRLPAQFAPVVTGGMKTKEAYAYMDREIRAQITEFWGSEDWEEI